MKRILKVNFSLSNMSIIVLVIDQPHVHLRQSTQEWAKQNLWKTAFKKFEVIWSAFKFFKGCLPQTLLDSLLNTLTYL